MITNASSRSKIGCGTFSWVGPAKAKVAMIHPVNKKGSGLIVGDKGGFTSKNRIKVGSMARCQADAPPQCLKAK
jgi:hypothetical protein